MFRDPPYAVRWAGWYVVILGLLSIPLFLYYAAKFEAISDPAVSAALTVYVGRWAILRAVLLVVPGFAMAKGFRPAFPIVLLLMVAGIIQPIMVFEESARFFGVIAAWIAIAAPLPALLYLLTPLAWQWFLGLGTTTKAQVPFREPATYQPPRRQ
jgi:hypothetical protein